MTEKEKPFQFKKFKEEPEVVHYVPPAWCGAICRNAMSEMCCEHCAIKRDTSYFEPKPDLNLSNMPRFPETKDMTKEEKFTSVAIYLSKVVNHLQGVDDEPIPIRRPYHDRTASSQVSANIEIKSILHGIAEATASLPATEKREDQNVRPEEVVGTSD
jgi:hypothetical protein